MVKNDYLEKYIESIFFVLLELFFNSLIFSRRFLIIIIIYDLYFIEKILDSFLLYLIMLSTYFIFNFVLIILISEKKSKTKKKKKNKSKKSPCTPTYLDFYPLKLFFQFFDFKPTDLHFYPFKGFFQFFDFKNYLKILCFISDFLYNFQEYYYFFVLVFQFLKYFYPFLTYWNFFLIVVIVSFFVLLLNEFIYKIMKNWERQSEFQSIEFELQLHMIEILLTKTKKTKENLIKSFDFYYQNNYTLTELENMIDQIVEKNPQTFQKFITKSGQEFIKTFGFINVFIKNIQTNQNLFTLRILPSMTIETLFQLVDQQFKSTNYHDLQFHNKFLSLNLKSSIKDLDIKNQSTIFLIVENVEGGGRTYKRKNPDQPLRRSKRLKILESNKDLKEEFSPSDTDFKIPSFPINDLGTRAQFFYLNDLEYISFQIILFWDTCFKKKISRKHFKPSTTWLCFLNNESRQIIKNKSHVFELFEKFENKEISLSHYIHDSRRNLFLRKNVFESRENNLTQLVNTLILTKQNYPDLNFDEFMNLLIHNLNINCPTMLDNSEIDPESFLLQINIMRSIGATLEKVRQNLGSSKMSSQITNTILIGALNLKNLDIKNSILEQKLNTSQYLIKIARNNILKMNQDDMQVFKKHYKKRFLFSKKTHEDIIKWWSSQTRPGRRYLVRPGSKNNEKDLVRFLDCSVYEFYEMYKQHEDFGQKAKTVKNKSQIPKMTFFLARKPHFIRKDHSFHNGYCALCMQAKEHLKTFHKLLINTENGCTCKGKFCPTFQHNNNCFTNYETNFHCTECTICHCENCKTCQKSNFKISLSWFFSKLICNDVNLDGRIMPKNLCCVDTHLQRNSCKKCKIETIEDLCCKICPSLFTNLDLNKEIISKKWIKKKIDSGYNSKGVKKKAFEVSQLIDCHISVELFLKTFLEFLITKRGFINHYYVSHYQRYQFNRLKSLLEAGIILENIVVFLTDFAENQPLNGGKEKSSNQYFCKDKAQMLSIIEYFNFNSTYNYISNIFFSPLWVKKNAELTIFEFERLILKHLEKNPKLETVVIWSDGSTKEFLNSTIFGNLGKLSKKLEITICWNYFSNMHGKSACDQHFARYKTKFKQIIFSIKKYGFHTAFELYNYCAKNLIPSKWKLTGKVTDRRFFYRENSIFDFPKFETVNDTKLFRCHLWDKDGIYYRRRNSCACLECLNAMGEKPIKCPNYPSCGDWKPGKLRMKKNQKNINNFLQEIFINHEEKIKIKETKFEEIEEITDLEIEENENEMQMYEEIEEILPNFNKKTDDPTYDSDLDWE